MSKAVRVALALALWSGLAEAQTGPDWFSDSKTGCRLYYPGAHASLTLRWSGGCANGLAEGAGAFELLFKGDSLAKGEGTFKAGKREGRAFVVKKDGMRLEAEYRDGEGVGKAVEIWPSGDRYVGDYANGEKSGFGVYTWANGNRYEGQWANDSQNGKGLLTGSNGDRYEGEWKNGEREGRGVYTWADKQRYEGDWVNGRPNGMGSFRGQATDGTVAVWTGEWRDGCYSANGRTAAVLRTRAECGF